MSLRDKLFSKRQAQTVELPAILQPEDPVNYGSVLEWMLGLSDKDYKAMLEVITIYRDARKGELKILNIKEEPTTQLIVPQQTDDEIDSDLDTLLDTHQDDLRASLEADSQDTPASNKQRKIAKKVSVKS